MRYTVVWKKSAADRLAEIWMAAADRGAVSVAADNIDAALRNNPLECGESRDENTRILIVPPLAVLYEVDQADRRVTVLAIRYTANRPQ
jgi:plasmid stabilization system protein ParE